MSKKPELFKTKKDPELFYYFNAKKEKMWCFRHRYYDALGKRREKPKQGFKSENEAYRELLEVKSSILNGDVKQVENESITVSEWLEIWYETKKARWKITTRKARRKIIDNYFTPILGKYKLSKLDAMTYERVFINKLLKKLEPSSVEQYHKIFKVALNAAVDNKVLKENNIKSVTFMDNEFNEENFLSGKELEKLLSTAKIEESITNYTLLKLLSDTGMRKGEALGLSWKNINYKDSSIKIEHTRDFNGIRSPKTKNSYRVIWIDDLLINELREYESWCKEKKFSYGKHISENDYVFISKRNTPYGNVTINHMLDRVIKKAKIKRITPHGLRHTHATILLNNKVSIPVVAKRLGNTQQEIMNTYGHSDIESEKLAVQIFSSAINS